jgi:hypothetical protein
LPSAPYYGEPEVRGKAIRADVVYFRQDFSVMHPVKEPGQWPNVQRFDYFVQVREVDQAQAEAVRARAKKSYQQREAVRWALARLRREPLALR